MLSDHTAGLRTCIRLMHPSRSLLRRDQQRKLENTVPLLSFLEGFKAAWIGLEIRGAELGEGYIRLAHPLNPQLMASVKIQRYIGIICWC